MIVRVMSASTLTLPFASLLSPHPPPKKYEGNKFLCCWFLQLVILGVFTQWVCGVEETQISHFQDEPTEQLLECAPVSSDLRVRKSGLLFMLLDSQPDLSESQASASTFSRTSYDAPTPFSEEGKTSGDRNSIFGRKWWDKE